VELFEELKMPGEAATCLHVLSLAYGSLFEFEPAFAAVQKAVKLSHEAGDTIQEATGLRRIAVVFIQQSDHAEALPYAEQALELHRKIGDRGEEINALNVLGIIYAWIKDPEKSDQYLREALNLGYEIGHGFGIRAPITNLIALHYRPNGNPEEWLNFIDIHLARAQEDEDELRVAYMIAFKAFALFAAGKIEDGIALMDYNIDEMGDMASHWELAVMNAYISLGYALLRDFDKAWECHGIAVQVSKDSGIRMNELMRMDERGAIAWHQGDEKVMAEALTELEATMDEIRATNEAYTLADRLEIAARLHIKLGDYEIALKQTTEMLELMEMVPGPYEPEVKYYTHAKALYGLGRDEEGDEFLKKARDRVTSVAEGIKDEALRRSWLENVKLNREILKVRAQRGISGSTTSPKGP
jgi:tetratricopeptide (TPR) repeat protein